MPLELQTALISALIALVTAGVSGYFTWNQVQREKTAGSLISRHPTPSNCTRHV